MNDTIEVCNHKNKKDHPCSEINCPMGLSTFREWYDKHGSCAYLKTEKITEKVCPWCRRKLPVEIFTSKGICIRCSGDDVIGPI